jgi:hypothetical protein
MHRNTLHDDAFPSLRVPAGAVYRVKGLFAY